MVQGYLSFTRKDMAFCFSIKIDPSKVSQAIIYSTFNTKSTYEPEVVYVLSEVLREGNVFVDVGAHIGYLSLVARSMVGETGKIYSVEPEYNNFEQLSDNIAINLYDNVHPIRAVVTDHSGMETLYVNIDNDGGHALWDCGLHFLNQKTRENPQTVQVEAITLDELAEKEGINHINLLKIDTEGAELRILHGAVQLLEEGRIRNIVLEVHSQGLELLGGNTEELFEYLGEFDYEPTILTPNGKPLNGNIYNTWFRKV